MVCYAAAMPCKQEYNLRREGRAKFPLQPVLNWFKHNQIRGEVSLQICTILEAVPGTSLASPSIKFCCRLSACCICPPSCAILHVEASCRKLQPRMAPRREGLMCAVDSSVWHRQQQQPIQQGWQPSSLLPSSPFYQLIPWQNTSNSVRDKLSTNKHTCCGAFPSRAVFFSVC